MKLSLQRGSNPLYVFLAVVVALQHPRALALNVRLIFVVLFATVSDGRVEERGLELRGSLRLLVGALGKLRFLFLFS